jgi:1-phosphatidylinositol-3-phosphate 5-kinase
MSVIYESPLFVGQHSKRVLRHSLWNDTLFLAKMNVMDYSLVIGIDEEHRDLILGIIGTDISNHSNKRFHSYVYLGQET